jgi:hypothetical protein
MTQSANQLQGISDALSPMGAETEMVGRGLTETFTAYFTDNDTANGVQTAEPIVKLDATKYPNGAKLIAAYVAPGIAVTGADAANKIVTFNKLTSAGGSSTAMAVLTTNAAFGNLAANQFGSATLTAANCIIAAGGIVNYAVTVTGAGVKFNGAVTVTGKSTVCVVLQAL